MAKRRIAVLGSTGSIGTQTLDVVRQHGDKLEIVGLAVNSSLDVLLAQAREFACAIWRWGMPLWRTIPVAMRRGPSCGRWPFPRARRTRRPSFGVGSEAVVALTPTARGGCRRERPGRGSWLGGELYDAEGGQGARFGQQGVARGGWRPHYAAGSSGGCGSSGLRVAPATGPAGALMPIDSEHGAIYQCLLGENPREISKLWVTASGGPFRGKTIADLEAVTPAQALAIPPGTWGRRSPSIPRR